MPLIWRGVILRQARCHPERLVQADVNERRGCTGARYCSGLWRWGCFCRGAASGQDRVGVMLPASPQAATHSMAHSPAAGRQDAGDAQRWTTGAANFRRIVLNWPGIRTVLVYRGICWNGLRALGFDAGAAKLSAEGETGSTATDVAQYMGLRRPKMEASSEAALPLWGWGKRPGCWPSRQRLLRPAFSPPGFRRRLPRACL